MQTDGPRTRPVRLLTDVFVPDEGPSGIGVVAMNVPSTSVSSIYEQAFGGLDELYLRSIIQALQLGKELNAEQIRVLCPDETTVGIVNREIPLELGSPLAPLYMRARALIYTYRRAEIRTAPKSRVRPARNLAITASRMPVRRADPQYELFTMAG